jgi:endonuclease-3
MLSKAKILEIFKKFDEINPNPPTELNYNSLFELTIAVVLSAQATDISVNKATKDLFKIYNTPKKIIELGEENLIQYIKSIGLFRTKAKNIIKLCNQIISLHNSDIPGTFDELIKLNGVGRKTANVILNVWFNKPTIAVDTHVYRVSKRMGLSDEDDIVRLEKQLEKVIPKRYLLKAHKWLILHGRYVCKARKPNCLACDFKDKCLQVN